MLSRSAAIGRLVRFAMILCMLMMMAGSWAFFSLHSTENPVVVHNTASVQVGQQSQPILLPDAIENLEEHTAVTVSFQLPEGDYTHLYYRTVFAPVRAYVNDVFVGEYGRTGTYPAFMRNPPTTGIVSAIPSGIEQPYTLRLEYQVPQDLHRLSVAPVWLGSLNAITEQLLQQHGASLLVIIGLLVMGTLLAVAGGFIIPLEEKGICFLWLGMLAGTAGMWGLGENDLGTFIIKNPSLLCLLAFVGLYLLPIALCRYPMVIVRFHDTRVIHTLWHFHQVFYIVTCCLQLAGRADMVDMLPVYVACMPLSMCILVICLAMEWVKYGNEMAKLQTFAYVEVLICTVSEAGNTIFGWGFEFGVISQVGILVFILINSVIGGILIHHSVQMQEQGKQLESEIQIMTYRVEEEHKKRAQLHQSEQTIRALRHDLRHQLAVIRQLSQAGDNEKLLEFIDSIIPQIPPKPKDYCENIAVNAIICHYVNMAQAENIKLSIKLVVPAELSEIGDSYLCVVFGNLLENAIEACRLLEVGKRFITLRSNLQYDMLVITMDNSFDGKVLLVGGKYFSRKRAEYGVGLRSIQSVAEQHEGNADFTQEGETFRSAVYFKARG